ncbi:MAG TPA: 16S rRNA (cytosine(1402)-N(4))-methyltransferase RsmH [Acidobacteria bacterium]|nr:16S rRNA (cytosine(1402)-N(4))-methyltransferase RsmH [Acidobacteriota bacterium]
MVLEGSVHRPVMVTEVLEALAPGRGRLLVDGTVGLGGHVEAWMEASSGEGRAVGLDRDASALDVARTRLAAWGERVELVHGDYRRAGEVLDRLGIDSIDAVLLDLGLGSHQLDDPERGFSFRHEGPLDMRFDRGLPGRQAAEILAHASAPELEAIFRDYGEERAARKLARVIVDHRQRRRLTTTTELADLVRGALGPSQRGRIDPATRVFQALRIAVNDELSGLGQAIEDLSRRLSPGGRIAVISFHSLEDRIAKNTLRRLAAGRQPQPDDPPEIEPLEPLLDLQVRRVTLAGQAEIAANPRARSARLRWGIRR